MDNVRDISFRDWATVFYGRHPSFDPQKNINPLEFIRHPNERGKYHYWFENAHWYIGKVSQEELEKVMVVSMERNNGTHLWHVGRDETRILGRMAWRATVPIDDSSNAYFFDERTPLKHREYYRRIKDDGYRLEDDNRLTLIFQDGGLGKIAKFYLHDGFGRGLPFMTLVREQLVEFPPEGLEVFVAEKSSV